MHEAIRPYMTTGIALVGASVIAVSPIIPVTAPPDIAIPVPTISSTAYELTSFHEELLGVLGPLLEGLSPGQVFDLLESVILANGGLFGGLALVVDQLLDGLTQLLAEGVPPVLDALVPVLETVFEGLSLVVLSLVPVVLSLVPVVLALTPLLLPVTVGLGVLLAGLPVVLLPVTVGLGALLGGLPLALVGLGALLGGLLGGIPLAAAPAVAEATAFGATDIENKAAAETVDLAIGPTEEGQDATLAENASPVAEVATDPEAEKPIEVLTEVQESLPEQAQGVGLETAIENQEDGTEAAESEAASDGTATDTSDSTSTGGTTAPSDTSGTSDGSSGSAGASDSTDGASDGGADSGSDSAGGDSSE